MKKVEGKGDMCLHLNGILSLIKPLSKDYRGVLKRGLRLLIWGNSPFRASSVHFLEDVDVNVGETRSCDIIIFSSSSIDKEIQVGQNYKIGYPQSAIANFQIVRVNGEWIGKIPK